MKLNLFHILILINVYCAVDGDYWADETNFNYAYLKAGEWHIIAAPKSHCLQFQVISDSYLTIDFGVDGSTFEKKLTVSIDHKEETLAATVQTASVHDYSINVTSKTIEPCCVEWMLPRKFWMSWKDNLLRIGRHSEIEPIIQYNYDVPYPNIHMQHLQIMSNEATCNLMYSKDGRANCPLPPPQKQPASCDDINYDIATVLQRDKRYELRVTSHKHMLFQFKTDMESYLQLFFGTYRLSKFQPKIRAYFDIIKQVEMHKVQLTQVYDYSIRTEASTVPEKTAMQPLRGPTDYNVSWVDNELIIQRACEVEPILQYRYNITEPTIDITHIQFKLVGIASNADIRISTTEKHDYLYMLPIDRNHQNLYDVVDDDCLEFNITTKSFLRLLMGYYKEEVFEVTLYADLAVRQNHMQINKLFDYATELFAVVTQEPYVDPIIPKNYWVTWQNGLLRIGRDSDYRPMIQYQYATDPENFITLFEFQLQDESENADLAIAKYAYCPKGRHPRSVEQKNKRRRRSKRQIY